MKKHALAVAVSAAFAMPAVAQVTVSGTLDITPHSTSKTTIGAATAEQNKVTRTDGGVGGWATSTLDFRATEDLGGGLKATAFVNQVINQTDGLLTARDRWIELGGGFGTLKAGRFSPAIEGYGSYAVGGGTTNTAGTSDSSGYDFIVGSLGYNNAISRSVSSATAAAWTTDIDGASDRAAVDMGRQSGIVQYTTPTFSGVKATVEMIRGKADRDAASRGGANDRNASALRLDFTQGNLALSVATGKSKVTREAAGASSVLLTATNSTNGAVSSTSDILIAGSRATLMREVKSDVQWVGASYNFGFARVHAAHGKRDDQVSDNGAAHTMLSDLKVSNVGLTVPVGALTFAASMYDGSDSRTATTNTDDVDLKGQQLSVRYALSKRTFAYVVTGENETKPKAGGTGTGYSKAQGTSIGVVHSF